MRDVEAQSIANEFIRITPQHQTNVFGMNTAPLLNLENAQKAAQALAEFRQELIKQLTQQP